MPMKSPGSVIGRKKRSASGPAQPDSRRAQAVGRRRAEQQGHRRDAGRDDRPSSSSADDERVRPEHVAVPAQREAFERERQRARVLWKENSTTTTSGANRKIRQYDDGSGSAGFAAALRARPRTNWIRLSRAMRSPSAMRP